MLALAASHRAGSGRNTLFTSPGQAVRTQEVRGTTATTELTTQGQRTQLTLRLTLSQQVVVRAVVLE